MTRTSADSRDQRVVAILSARLSLPRASLLPALRLLDEGCTVPFIARYRKDQTRGLDDEQLRSLVDEREQAEALESRRDAIAASMSELGFMTEERSRALAALTSKRELEDFYRPFKPTRTTKAAKAEAAGLGPLADAIRDPEERRPDSVLARGFVDAARGVADPGAALSGAREILIEGFARDPGLRAELRRRRERGRLVVKAARGKKEEAAAGNYRDLVGLDTPLQRLRGHRVMAVNRGESEGLLSVRILGRDPKEAEALARRFTPRRARPILLEAFEKSLKDRVGPAVERELRQELTEEAHSGAIATFRENLRQRLMEPPLGRKVILGVDPGFRSGCKCAVVDGHGVYRGSVTIFPNPPKARPEKARADLLALVDAHGVEVVAIGNGTASRETARFVRAALKSCQEDSGRAVQQCVVSEAGASVYSASAVARAEHPDLDVTVRGCLSIARRVQDPLAELVKIEPRSLGLGQYQHDLDEGRLSRALDGVVEQAVNQVGVDLNRASAPLLQRVSGLNAKTAAAIVAARGSGPFPGRSALMKVKGIGARTYQQAAGFLRIPDGAEPLDRTAIHPDHYPVARAIAARLGKPIAELAGAPELAGLDAESFVSGEVGAATVADILEELARPGRDPRGEAAGLEYSEGVERFEDLTIGMSLTGNVTNLTDFGAFVDLGVGRDGLIHVSRFGRRVGHPSEAVRLGERVKVVVEGVDAERRRISLALVPK